MKKSEIVKVARDMFLDMTGNEFGGRIMFICIAVKRAAQHLSKEMWFSGIRVTKPARAVIKDIVFMINGKATYSEYLCGLGINTWKLTYKEIQQMRYDFMTGMMNYYEGQGQ